MKLLPQLAWAVCFLGALVCVATVLQAELLPRSGGRVDSRVYPWHTDITATTFWVGEVFDPDAEDGSQEISTYDPDWLTSYGGCDGVMVDGRCETEVRSSANDYFPTAMTPRENPFYLDLPFDDVNDDTAFQMRGDVVPWADDEPYADRVDDRDVSLMKDRWVMLRKGDRVCFGQVEDAGPGEYHDAEYVFGSDDVRPRNARYGGAGLDVSPAINGCLGFSAVNGTVDAVDWRFVEEHEVPRGPWKKVVTRTPPS